MFDGLSGIAGPYAHKIFKELLGVNEACLKNCEALEDFGGLHPDPNLTYAKSLVDEMGKFYYNLFNQILLNSHIMKYNH